jgi:putative ribosome biogenesis GTPase RsgA
MSLHLQLQSLLFVQRYLFLPRTAGQNPHIILIKLSNCTKENIYKNEKKKVTTDFPSMI